MSLELTFKLNTLGQLFVLITYGPVDY